MLHRSRFSLSVFPEWLLLPFLSSMVPLGQCIMIYLVLLLGNEIVSSILLLKMMRHQLVPRK